MRNITPQLLAVLISIKSPFYVGGEYTYPHVAQFLCALHAEDLEPDAENIRRMLQSASRFTLSECARQIKDFIDLTFLDAPKSSGTPEKPIASEIAWLRYRFRGKPFEMEFDEIMETPLRILYQELRCWQKENGVHVSNPSDKLSRSWLEQVQHYLSTGELTQADLDEFNERMRKQREEGNAS